MKPFWCRKDWKWLTIHHTIKPPLLKILNLVDDLLPYPTLENCHLENSRSLCKVRDEFLRRLKLGETRGKALRAIWNLVIIMHEHDEPYRDLMDWCKRELDKQPWETLSPNSPTIQIFKRDWEVEEENTK